MDDEVVLSARTAPGNVIRCAMPAREWDGIKREGPTMFGCVDCEELVDESARHYPGDMLLCPTCDSRMDRISIIMPD